jgi:ADP-heptose:LPS heptosyltransferase
MDFLSRIVWKEEKIYYRCFSNIVLQYSIRKIQENRKGFSPNGMRKLLVYSDIKWTAEYYKEKAQGILDSTVQINIDVKANESNVSRYIATRLYCTKVSNKSFENMANLIYSALVITNHVWI